MLVKRLKFISSFIGLLMGLLTNTAYAEQQGLSVDMLYIGEGVQNVSGGLKQDSTYLGTGDLAMVIDTEQADWWQGGTWFIEALVNHGTDPSSLSVMHKQQATLPMATVHVCSNFGMSIH